MSEDFDKGDFNGYVAVVEPVEEAMLNYFEHNCMKHAKHVTKLNEAIQEAAAKGELEVTVLLAEFGGFSGGGGGQHLDARWKREQEFRKFLRNYLRWLGYTTGWGDDLAAWYMEPERGERPWAWNGLGLNKTHFKAPNNNLLESVDCRLFETSEQQSAENTIHQIWRTTTLTVGWETTDFSEPKKGVTSKVYVMNQPRPTQWKK